MSLKRLRGAAIAVSALVLTTGIVHAAGNYSTYPQVGAPSFCVSTVGVNGQQGNTGQGGGTAGTAGAYCAQTVPAGPSIVTGTELVPADTGLANGAPPQSVVLSLASLNALPIYNFTAATAAQNTLVASATAGGYMFHGSGTISAVQITLPSAPIDGQQFAVSGDQTITTLTLTTVAGAPGGTAAPTIAKNPTVLTSSTTASYGYRLMYSAIQNAWMRLQ